MEKDLGVHVHKSLKVKEQVNYVVKKANRLLGTIRRAYTDKNMKNIKNVYITLVRPIIENCQQARSPYLQKDIDKLESVQRRATKMLTGISKLPYYLRLRKCGLLSLHDRRKRADMLEVFKIINGFTDIDTKIIFELIHTPRPGRQQINSSTPQPPRCTPQVLFTASNQAMEYPSRQHDVENTLFQRQVPRFGDVGN